MAEVLDCLVIGGGPAGLTAALYLARFRRRVAVIDNRDSRAELIPVSHNFPGFPDGVTGPGLLARLREQLEPYDIVQLTGTVEELSRVEGVYRADWQGGAIMARCVMLTTGIADSGVGVPNWRAGIASGALRLCPVCDAYEVIDKRIAVIARSEHAAAHAEFLRTYSTDLTLVHVDRAPLPAAERRALEDRGIAVVETAQVVLTIDAAGAMSVRCDGQDLCFDAVYPMFGFRPRTGLARRLGAACDSDGNLLTDAFQMTSVPGLYAAGDVVSGLNQISVAAGQAAVAATHIHHELGQPLNAI